MLRWHEGFDLISYILDWLFGLFGLEPGALVDALAARLTHVRSPA